MNTEIIPFEKDGQEIVWFIHNEKPLLPVKSLFALFDMEYKHGMQVIIRNLELFDGKVIDIESNEYNDSDLMMRIQLTSGRGKQLYIKCLTVAGVFQWLSRLDYNRYNEERRELIIKTQRWLVDTGESVIMRSKIPAPEVKKLPSGIGDVFNQCISVTDVIEKKHHVDPVLGTIMALQETQKITGHDMSGFQSLLPPAPVEDMSYLTPTDLTVKLELRNSRQANKMLEMMGMQYKQQDGKKSDWFPTDAGKPHCSAQTFRNAQNNHSGYQLKWKESIIPVMEAWIEEHYDMFQ